MSYDENGLDAGLRTAYRGEVAAVLEGIGDIREYWRGAIVTGYVVAVEVTLDARHQGVMWLTGDGTPPTDDDAGWIAEHRVRGILGQVMWDIDSERVDRE